MTSISPQPPTTGHQPSATPALAPERSAGARVSPRLSTALIVVGLLLLVGGGVMAYVNLVAYVEPPPPVGLEENPLPVVTLDCLTSMTGDLKPASACAENHTPVVPGQPGDGAGSDLPAVGVSRATPMPTSPPSVTDVGGTEEGRWDIPATLSPSPTPTFLPPATSPPTRIVVPAIGLDARVVPVGWKEVTQDGKKVSVWELADYAAGWHKNSALPGQGGNIVLSGHHNVKGEVFRYIVDLTPGNAVILYADGRLYTYTVESRFVVKDKGEPEEKRLENARWIGPFPDERLTLVTCWPYTSNTHRVIVIAKPATR